MSTLFIFFLLMVTTFFIAVNYRKASIFASAIVLIFFLLIGNGFIPWLLLKYLESPFTTNTKNVEVQWKNKNAIVLLGAGNVKLNNYRIKPSILAFSRINETVFILYQN